MRILVVGGGAREHAIAWALAKHNHEVLCVPGNPGIERVARLCSGDPVDVAAKERVDLVVVGPEAPLVAGLGDRLRAEKIPCFGPGAAGARLEGSKAFTKRFFASHGIPTAEFAVCDSVAAVDEALARFGDRVVVKADGLAAGKGVVVCSNAHEARAAAVQMLGGSLGDAGRSLVIERRLGGREASILAITDGMRTIVLPSAEDHKAIFDGDQGPNTGGMGAISPTPVLDEALLERVRHDVLAPTVRGLAHDGIDYRGVLYAGIMVAPDGTPNMLEYNCRFGDPETEVQFARWQDDPAHWLLGAAQGKLPDGEPKFDPRPAVCVVLSAAGYPGAPRGGDRIDGIEAAEAGGAIVFHAGTRRIADGTLVTAGGRVLVVTALGDDLEAARTRAYAAVAKIRFEGSHHRTDIGARRS